MEGVFINMFTWAWKRGGQAPAFSGLLHPGAGDQITTRQEKIKGAAHRHGAWEGQGIQEAGQRIAEVEVRRSISITLHGSLPGASWCTFSSCWWGWSSLRASQGARFSTLSFSWQLPPKLWHGRSWTRRREHGALGRDQPRSAALIALPEFSDRLQLLGAFISREPSGEAGLQGSHAAGHVNEGGVQLTAPSIHRECSPIWDYIVGMGWHQSIWNWRTAWLA